MGKPAARLGDPTVHGGTVIVGFPTVLIGGKPAARIGDMHVCPMVIPGTPPIPHVGGPITMGSPTVLIGNMPAARMGDMAICVGPPDTIVMGCPTVLIGMAGGGGAGAAGAAVGANAPSFAVKTKRRGGVFGAIVGGIVGAIADAVVGAAIGGLPGAIVGGIVGAVKGAIVVPAIGCSTILIRMAKGGGAGAAGVATGVAALGFAVKTEKRRGLFGAIAGGIAGTIVGDKVGAAIGELPGAIVDGIAGAMRGAAEVNKWGMAAGKLCFGSAAGDLGRMTRKLKDLGKLGKGLWDTRQMWKDALGSTDTIGRIIGGRSGKIQSFLKEHKIPTPFKGGDYGTRPMSASAAAKWSGQAGLAIGKNALGAFGKNSLLSVVWTAAGAAVQNACDVCKGKQTVGQAVGKTVYTVAREVPSIAVSAIGGVVGSAVGAVALGAIGGVLGGPVGAVIGAKLGAVVGNFVGSWAAGKLEERFLKSRKHIDRWTNQGEMVIKPVSSAVTAQSSPLAKIFPLTGEVINSTLAILPKGNLPKR